MYVSNINTQNCSYLKRKFREYWEKYQKNHESITDINISDGYVFIKNSFKSLLLNNFDLEFGCLCV
jgi:hypothetical protein